MKGTLQRHFQMILLVSVGAFCVLAGMAMSRLGIEKELTAMVVQAGVGAFASLGVLLTQALSQRRQTDEVRHERGPIPGQSATVTKHESVTDLPQVKP